MATPDATLRPRYHDLMGVLVGSIERAVRRHPGRRALECRLSWAQILENLRAVQRSFNLSYAEAGSRRSLARWLGGMERDRFVYRDTATRRDRAGRIRWRLTKFTFGVAGILWIKNHWKGGTTLLARTIVPKVAVRLKNSVKSFKTVNDAVEKSPTALPKNQTPRKSAALRARTSSSTRIATRAKKTLVRKGPGRPATKPPGARKPKRQGSGHNPSRRRP